MRAIWILAAVTLAAPGCKKREGGAARKVPAEDGSRDAGAAATVEPLGPVRGPVARAQLVIHVAAAKLAGARAAFERAVAAEPGLRVVDAPSAAVAAAEVAYREQQAPECDPPAPDELAYLGRELSAADEQVLAGVGACVVLSFSAPAADAVAQLRRVHRVGTPLAAALGGLVWSTEQRLLFGAGAWAKRATALDGDVPDLVPLVVIHVYREAAGQGLREVSLGLEQLGLPDLVVAGVVDVDREQAGELLNLVAQTLEEGAEPAADGTLSVDVARIRNPAAAERFRGDMVETGTGKTTVRLVAARPEPGDADNRLWRIDVPGDGSYLERLTTALAQVFGRGDQVIYASHDDPELTAASARARKALAALRSRVARGLDTGEAIIVKAPFATASGSAEYMWIEVRTWKGPVLTGVLTDEPFDVPDLHAGATVEVAEGDVFDYIHRKPDGTLEGGETNAILERREAPRQP
jgi:uncharacterized protein YegJ (DUF2314 family)